MEHRVKITIKDYVFCVTGNFKSFQNKGAVLAAIKAAGGKTTASLAASTTALVLGDGYTPMEKTARARGMLILYEAQLRELLASGSIDGPTRDDAPAKQVTRDEGLSELRAALAEPPGRHTWKVITTTLSEIPTEQLHEVLPYVQSHLLRWDELVRPTRRWDKESPFEECCIAPDTWLTRMMHGESDARFQIVRAISLDDLKIKNADMLKLLQVQDLTQLRTLDMGDGNTYAGNVWKLLLSGCIAPQLENLRITSFRDAHAKALNTPHQLKKLRHVRILYSSLSKYDESAVEALFATDWMQQIDTLTLEAFQPYPDDTRERWHRAIAKLPHLEHLNLDVHGSHFSFSHSVITSAIPATALHIIYDPFPLQAEQEHKYAPQLLNAKPTIKRKLLDLSGVEPRRYPDASYQELQAACFDQLAGSALLTGFEQVQLGRWWTPKRAEAITRAGTEVLAPPVA